MPTIGPDGGSNGGTTDTPAPVTPAASTGYTPSALSGDTAAPSATPSSIGQIPFIGSTLAGVASSIGSALTGNNPTTTASDTRIRLAALNPAAVYGNSPIMAILNETQGMLFPYTPTINVTQGVNYMDLQLVHSNTDYQAYTRTPSVKITVSGKFTVQNYREGRYALAAIHFLRTASKSYFGEKDAMSQGTAASPLANLAGTPIGALASGSAAGGGNAGLPPPVLLFSGYGNLMFNRLRVILTNHSITFDEAMDTVSIPINATAGPSLNLLPNILGGQLSGGVVRLPALFTISVDLTVIQTPKRMRTQFSFNDFANGTLMNSSDGGWI